MINLSNIVDGIEHVLTNDANLSEYPIEVEGVVNEDTNREVWIGIYAGRFALAPLVLGNRARNWQAKPAPMVVVRVSGAGSTRALAELRNQVTQWVVAAFDNDRTLNGAVDMLVGVDVDNSYSIENRAAFYVLTAKITLNVEVRT